MSSRVSGWSPGFEIVMVYPSESPTGTAALSAVLVTVSGAAPLGENTFSADTVELSPGAMVTGQLSPSPLSYGPLGLSLAQLVSIPVFAPASCTLGNCAPDPTPSHTQSKYPSM